MDVLTGIKTLISSIPQNIINLISNQNTEVVWFLMLILCFLSILVFLRLFGYVGLYVYSAIAIIVANIQVLKQANFNFFSSINEKIIPFYEPSPIALGTILFASTFLCTDILSEYYGKEKARKNVLIGFCSFFLMTILMLVTIGIQPAEDEWVSMVQESLAILFTPMTSIFVASMIAYLISQYFDIWFFSYLKTVSSNKLLWLRNNVSTAVSSLIDNTIFSIFAWIILNPNPFPLSDVIMTFILGVYLLRVFIAILDTPFIYLAKYFIPEEKNSSPEMG
ncbi:queuosine precursor transporter [Pelagibacteraceae bacterium]|nr:queuosine precursor transporter [Pelagibacteraceae bacterium]MDC3156251.1 queuosine precursor transporter [Pelagibacteraceae bacterium]